MKLLLLSLLLLLQNELLLLMLLLQLMLQRLTSMNLASVIIATVVRMCLKDWSGRGRVWHSIHHVNANGRRTKVICTRRRRRRRKVLVWLDML
ncbi:hypothetical protein EDD21DRAFT_375897 [Dissophora ornata]|nr:hypothetical protein EDD21DRAFT_375897 [Dissophora ornata]